MLFSNPSHSFAGLGRYKSKTKQFLVKTKPVLIRDCGLRKSRAQFEFVMFSVRSPTCLICFWCQLAAAINTENQRYRWWLHFSNFHIYRSELGKFMAVNSPLLLRFYCVLVISTSALKIHCCTGSLFLVLACTNTLWLLPIAPFPTCRRPLQCASIQLVIATNTAAYSKFKTCLIF